MQVLRGEAGVGKTALLEYVAEQASGCRVVRVVGVQSEMELAYAGLHQLCAGLLEGLAALPRPQRDALQVALGSAEGGPSDHFMVALAVLNLMSEAAEVSPLVCLIDDAQWLDGASAQALGFVARRLLAERIAMVFAVREPGDVPELDGLPDLVVTGLPVADARLLLAAVVPGRLDELVVDRIVAEAQGNPLALLELPRGMTPADTCRWIRTSRPRDADEPCRASLRSPGRLASPGLGSVDADRGGRAPGRRHPAVARC